MSEYLFNLPDEVLATLQLRTLVQPDQPGQPNQQDQEATTSLGCASCQIKTLGSVAAQREHFKSDWHKYNIKHSKIVGEEEFEQLADALSSISGSTYSAISSLTSSNDSDEAPKQAGSPLVWFTGGPNTQYGIYRAALPPPPKTPIPDYPKILKQIRVQPIKPALSKKDKSAGAQEPAPATDVHSRTWAIIMVGGGHFAAMIVSLVPKYVKHSGKLEREVVILESKTFHRYTTRRKQGGSQSVNDQAKSKAKSAGAQIRRYNEQALQEDIRELFAKWADQLKAADLIFIRSSKQNSKIIYNYDAAVLQRADPRIRTIPFPTRRPTQSELQRVFAELTNVKVSHLADEALKKLDEDYLAEQKRQQKPKPVVAKPSATKVKDTEPALSADEQRDRSRWHRILDMSSRNKLDALIAFVEKRQEDSEVDWVGDLPAWHEDAKTLPTLLHHASFHDSADVVRYLLLDCKADPTRLSSSSKTAYELAPTRFTRNVYRRLMADHPTLCDWPASRVPSALTEAQEAAQKERNKERKVKLRERQKERDEAQREQEAKRKEIEQKAAALKLKEEEAKRLARPNGAQKLGGTQRPGLGMSPEVRATLERERRARAAEARLKALGGS